MEASKNSCEAWLFYLHWRRHTRDAYPWVQQTRHFPRLDLEGNPVLDENDHPIIDSESVFYATRKFREGQTDFKQSGSGNWFPVRGSFAVWFPETWQNVNLVWHPGNGTGCFKYPWQEWYPEAITLRGLPGLDGDNFYTAWIRQALSNPNTQLRQRVAWALSQILVVSMNNPVLSNPDAVPNVFWGFANYWDLLQSYAFGDYAALVKRVAVHPIMGLYLSHAGNSAPHIVLNTSTTVAEPTVAPGLVEGIHYGEWLNMDGYPVFGDRLTGKLFVHYPGGNAWRTPLTSLKVGGVTYETIGDLMQAAQSGDVRFRVISPDENFAREIMQLFTVGLFKDFGNGPTTELVYDLDDVRNLARVFTGLCPTTRPAHREFGGGGYSYIHPGLRGVRPMMMSEAHHDFGGKTIMDTNFDPFALDGNPNVEIQPQYPPTAAMHRAMEGLAMREISAVVDFLVHGDYPTATGRDDQIAGFTARHISRQLIKHLVTSNPSHAYVEKIAGVFMDAGASKAGTGYTRQNQLGHVVEAILLHPEARDWRAFVVDREQGRLLDPLVRQVGIMRALDAGGGFAQLPEPKDPLDGPTWFQTFARSQGPSTFTTAMDAVPFNAPSVFNFYQPTHKPGGLLTKMGLTAPEFQIHGEGKLNSAMIGMYRDLIPGSHTDIIPTNAWATRYDLLTGFPGFAGPCESSWWWNQCGIAQGQIAVDTDKLFQANWVQFHTNGNPNDPVDTTGERNAVLERFDVLFCRGRMSAHTRTALTATGVGSPPDATSPERMARLLLTLPDSMILK